MSFATGVVLILYILQLLSLLAVIFIEDKDPVSTLSWILVLIFLPIIGLVFYLFFGRGLSGIANKKLKLLSNLRANFGKSTLNGRDYFKTTQQIMNGEEIEQLDPKVKDYLSISTLITNLNYTPLVKNNSIKIFIDAREKYDNLFEDIKKAEIFIHITYFIISNSSISHQLIDLLAQKAAEGVEVKVMYDEIGNFVVPSRMFNKITKAGGEVYTFFPLNFKDILHANYRNHHKIVVIDGIIGYTGGMNIGDEYMGMRPKVSPWRDTHMRLTGEIVSSLESFFILDLYYITPNLKKIEPLLTEKYFPEHNTDEGQVAMQLVYSGPEEDIHAIKRTFVSMINHATKSVFIQTPYFMPDQPLMEAIQNAAKSGVDVKLMLPGIADKQIPYYVTYSYIQQMLDYGVEVYLYNGFIHAKTMVIDDTIATIGTTNFDVRSLCIHFELNNIIFDSKVSEECSKIFYNDIEDCKLMTKELYNSRSNWRKFLEKVFRLFAPLM